MHEKGVFNWHQAVYTNDVLVPSPSHNEAVPILHFSIHFIFPRGRHTCRVLSSEARIIFHLFSFAIQKILKRTDDSGGIACSNASGRNIMGDHTPSADDNVIANQHTRKHDGTRTDEHTIANFDLAEPRVIQMAFRASVMSKNVNAWRQRYVIANLNKPSVRDINDDLVKNGNALADYHASHAMAFNWIILEDDILDLSRNRKQTLHHFSNQEPLDHSMSRSATIHEIR
jgi:hypothetical protein